MYSNLNWIVRVLVVAADAQMAIGIEHIKTDSVCPAIRVVQTVHPEDPLLLPHSALSQPMNVGFREVKALPLGSGKVQRRWPDPGRYGQGTSGRETEIGTVWYLDVALKAIEMEV